MSDKKRTLIDLGGETVIVVYFEKNYKHLSWVRIFNSDGQSITIQSDQAVILNEVLDQFKIFKEDCNVKEN
jgi:hypothetical protein